MKFLTKEIKIALSAICAIALLVCGINFLKGINIFKSNNMFYVAFTDISGLAESNPVYASGYRIGTVHRINYDYNHPGNVYVVVEVEKGMHIPEGSYAELDAQMLGGVTMNIILGQSPRMLTPGDTILGGPHKGALDKAANMVPKVEEMLPKLDSVLAGVNAIVNNPALQQTLANTAEITNELKSTVRTLNTLMSRDVSKITANLEPATEHLNSVSEKLDQIDYLTTINSVNQTLASLQEFTNNLEKGVSPLLNSLNSDNSTLGLLMRDRQLYDNLTNTANSADLLLQDLKNNPKRYVHFSIFGKKDK